MFFFFLAGIAFLIIAITTIIVVVAAAIDVVVGVVQEIGGCISSSINRASQVVYKHTIDDIPIRVVRGAAYITAATATAGIFVAVGVILHR